jgi:hypothetical protein
MMKYENAIDADHLEDDRGAINHRVYPVIHCWCIATSLLTGRGERKAAGPASLHHFNELVAGSMPWSSKLVVGRILTWCTRRPALAAACTVASRAQLRVL